MTTDEGGSGLQQFRAEMDPILAETIDTWATQPDLAPLHATLQANQDREVFLDAYAEAVVADRLLRHGCSVRVHVETPRGRQCDFGVSRDGVEFFLHVKRLHAERPARQLTLSPRLRYLERVRRPYIVEVRLAEGLDAERIRHFVTESASFIRQARVGDETVVRDADGRSLGGCRILAPWTGERVSVVLGFPKGFEDVVPRVRRLLRRAHRQFMPGAVNATLIGSGHIDDAEEVDRALLGTHVERWDALPPRGARVAHGRDDDGFWSGRRVQDSFAAGWFHLQPCTTGKRWRLWLRSTVSIEPTVERLLTALFDESKRHRRDGTIAG